ncbi:MULTISPECIES: TonB-dependent receptor [Nguyenibacter]|uniref:TonB-dependent receptor n=1 Tax=Nguyenibacter vanlangensis TaxID=1216886 RepID=A0A7Y7IXD4_9PROT|nr:MULTISPECIES: TonB-dependent receptor [Nguyenibacter]NVN12138.1 hypothetical protein [Nguyenibacter vanlangensis]WRH86885.1 TonB-dependent receptor [Nguyenibacter sp. L1]
MPVQTAPRAQSGVTRDQMNIRNEEQIGFVFEGVPIADPIRYAPYTNTVVDTENLGPVTVSQGSPDVDAPFYNAVGGQVTMKEVNPSHKMGGFLSLANGTHSANKEFARFETGDIGNGGIRGFVSFSHMSWNSWRGPGGGRRYHLDAKFVKAWGRDNAIAGLFSYNATTFNSFVDPTLAQWHQYGRGLNYDGGAYNGNDPNYYKLNSNLNHAMTVAAPAHFRLAPAVTLDVTPYYMHMFGPAPYGERINTTQSYFGTVPTGSLGIGGAAPDTEITTLASYKLTPRDQIYVNGTTSFRAPGSVAAFNYNIVNHQVTSYGYIPGTNSLVSEPLNVGGETSRGIEAELGLAHWHHFSPYLSGQYLHATFDNNYNDGIGYLPTAGKIAVDSPKFTGAIGLQYDDGRLFANFDLRYVDSQYTTFMNDQALHAYVTSNLALGCRLKAIGPARHPQIQLNLMNLGDNKYLSGAGSNTGAAHDTRATNGQIVAGAAPVYVVGGGFSALVSMSAGF